MINIEVNNKVIIVCILKILLFQNCYSQVNNTILGKWEKITLLDNKKIIFNPCDAENRMIIVDGKKITIDYGQENISYIIKKEVFDKRLKQGLIITEENERIQYQVLNNHEIEWIIPENMLDCRDYSEEIPIAKITVLNNVLEFNWLGFYNIKPRKKFI